MSDFLMDDNFEPQARSRSNTWPVRPKEVNIEAISPGPPDQLQNGDSTNSIADGSTANNAKKGGARKNAWGSFSYADLISKAIESSPEKRLTLAQIYDWLVQNIPYFKDKGECNSSAGWKNSIRHNLSLHSRFIRVQNEGTGKSSWWMINPDGKGIKSSRRRTASVDPHGDLIKKRNKAKTRVEQLKCGTDGLPVVSHGDSDVDFSDFPNTCGDTGFDAFAYGQEFRTRSGSNASSYGRRSPLLPLLEPSASPTWGSQQMLNGETMSGMIANSDNLTDLWDAMTLSTEAESMFSTNPLNATEQLSLNMNNIYSADANAYQHAPPLYNEVSTDVKPLLVMQQHSPHSRPGIGMMQGLNGSGMVTQISSPRNSNGCLVSQMPQENSYSTMNSVHAASAGASMQMQLSPHSRNTMTQQQLETQSLINELLADGVKNETSIRYQYGTDRSSGDISQDVQINRNQYVAFSDPTLIEYKPTLNGLMPQAARNGNDAFGPMSQMLTNKVFPGDYFSQNVDNSAKPVVNQALSASSYPSLMSAPFGNQSSVGLAPPPNTANSNGIRTAPTAGFQQYSKQQHDSLLSFMQRQRQHHMSGGGLQLAVGGGIGASLPGDIDITLQELRAGGLQCDMEKILREGNLDLTVD